jgi:hypothetical protein
MYYLVKAKFEIEDENTNRTRKIIEQYLVSADTISHAEEKIRERFKDTIAEFSTVMIQESKIIGVIE